MPTLAILLETCMLPGELFYDVFVKSSGLRVAQQIEKYLKW